jgi:CheY-like chemotaxis protein
MSKDTKKSILVIEDDREIRNALKEALQDEGFTVSTAENGRQALDNLKAATCLPCVILLDLMMPVMDGTTFRQEQVADPRLAGIPTAVLSADGRIHEKTANLGLTDSLKKPIDLDAVLAIVARYCR